MEHSIMQYNPDRKKFTKEWKSVLIFLILVTLPTLWGLLDPETAIQRSLGTIAVTTLIGLIAWFFLRREGVKANDIGLGKYHLRNGLILFLVWWLLVSGIDHLSSWVTGLLVSPLSPIGELVFSWETLLDGVRAFIFVGFAEEIAFRGYLHNKLIKICSKRWAGILLAALAFSIWHIPGSIIAGRATPMSLVTGTLTFTVISLLFFNLPYEWSGLLPFLALFHGWSDFPILVTMGSPTVVGAVAGYGLVFPLIWLFRKITLKPQMDQ